MKKAMHINRKRIFIPGLLFSGLIFIILAFINPSDGFHTVDLKITQTLQSPQSPLLLKLMVLVSWFGYPPQAFILVAASTVVLLGLHHFREAILSAVSSFCTLELTWLLKILVRRPRPDAAYVHVFLKLYDYSFPSGHVMFYVVYFGFFWYLSFIFPGRSWKRNTLLALFGLPVLLVGYSRVFLGEHWASDVLGGYLLGGMLLAALIEVEKLIRNRQTES